MNYKFSQIRNRVYLVRADTQYSLSSMFVRLQEFYESPINGIKGCYFTLEDYMDKYAETRWHKNFSYFEDWSGFNVPGEVIREFYETFENYYSNKEFKLFTEIESIGEDIMFGDDKFYIVGIYGKKIKPAILNHELSHAYWYLYHNYKTKMQKALDKLNPTVYQTMQAKLISMGYDSETMQDEICSYLATTKRGAIICVFGLDPKTRIPTTFKKIFNKYNNCIKAQVAER